MTTLMSPTPVASASTAKPAGTRWLPPIRDWRPSVVLALTWLVGLSILAIFADYLPFVRKYHSFMRCPSCGRRTWMRVRWEP